MLGIYRFIREFPMTSKQSRNLFYCEMDQYKLRRDVPRTRTYIEASCMLVGVTTNLTKVS